MLSGVPTIFACTCACRRQQEEEKIRRIAEMEEAQLAAEDKFSNRQEEAEQKTKKLKKLWKKFQEVRGVGGLWMWSATSFPAHALVSFLPASCESFNRQSKKVKGLL